MTRVAPTRLATDTLGDVGCLAERQRQLSRGNHRLEMPPLSLVGGVPKSLEKCSKREISEIAR